MQYLRLRERRGEVGDRVALHWDWVCEVLTADQARVIEERERRQRAAVGLLAAG